MKNRILILLYLSLAFLANPIFATEIAGKVAFSFGHVSAQDSNGIKRELSKGDEIYAGDTLITEEGRLQISMTDGAFISVQPRSQYVIEDYHFKQETDGKESSIYRLLKGGIRAVTGLIGKRNRDAYKVHTPAATIGIRGTGHNTRICAGDCFDALGNLLADGLHHSTWEGQTFVQNATGTQEVPTGKGVFVEGTGAKPKVLNSPPKIVRAVTTQSKKIIQDRVKKEITTGDETIGGVKKVVLEAAGLNSDNDDKKFTFATAFSDTNGNGDGNDQAQVFEARAFGNPPRAASRIFNGNNESVIFNGQVADFVEIADVQLFRWTNGTAAFFQNGVFENASNLNANQGLHVAVVDQTNVIMPSTGSGLYMLNQTTKSTQNNGAFLGAGLKSGSPFNSQLMVNFTTATLDADLYVDHNNIYHIDADSIPIVNARFNSLQGGNVSVNGCNNSATCTGQFAGAFSSSSTKTHFFNFGVATPRHVGLSYGIVDENAAGTDNVQIQGAGILTAN